jgi:hypothetical protein
MAGDDAFLREVESAVEQELAAVTKLRAEARDELAGGEPNRRILGSVLHDFYNCCERIFKRVSAEINGTHYQGDGWHKELLYRMTVPVPGLRPALLSEELAAELDEYLAFRHVFRNIYGFELKGERVVRLSRALEAIGLRFEQSVRTFLVGLRAEDEPPR